MEKTLIIGNYLVASSPSTFSLYDLSKLAKDLGSFAVPDPTFAELVKTATAIKDTPSEFVLIYKDGRVTIRKSFPKVPYTIKDKVERSRFEFAKSILTEPTGIEVTNVYDTVFSARVALSVLSERIATLTYCKAGKLYLGSNSYLEVLNVDTTYEGEVYPEIRKHSGTIYHLDNYVAIRDDFPSVHLIAIRRSSGNVDTKINAINSVLSKPPISRFSIDTKTLSAIAKASKKYGDHIMPVITGTKLTIEDRSSNLIIETDIEIEGEPLERIRVIEPGIFSAFNEDTNFRIIDQPLALVGSTATKTAISVCGGDHD